MVAKLWHQTWRVASALTDEKPMAATAQRSRDGAVSRKPASAKRALARTTTPDSPPHAHL